MRQLQQDFNTGEPELVEIPPPTLRPEGVLVETRHSLVSAGTERAMLDLGQKNLAGMALERPDLAKEVLKKLRQDGLTSTYRSVKARLDEPQPLGYSCAGEVVEVGEKVSDIEVGDTVACGGAGYASHAEVNYVPENLCVSVPDAVSTQSAAFTTLGAIAIQGVRRLDATPGERIAVIGLGLVGQLTAKILSAYGYPVIGFDIDPSQVDAIDCLDDGVVIGDDNIEQTVDAFTNGVGADGVLITAATDSNQPVEIAGDICRERGTVVAVGDVGMNVPRDQYYENELDLRVSRSYGPGRYDRAYEEQGLDYPIGHVRWTERRNMREFLRLVGEDRVTVADMITHTYPVDEALDAYDLIMDGSEPFVGVLIEFPEKTDQRSTHIQISEGAKQRVDGAVGVGLVGSGTFATSVLLPTIDDVSGFDLRAVATASGESARSAAEKYGAAYAATDYRELIQDADVDLLVVATRHNLHAEIATAALDADVDVHVEKPPVLNDKELQTLIEAEAGSDGRLMVGYNRRFSQSAVEAREQFADRDTPLVGQYRINVDRLLSDHWVYDRDEGGGRIVGELCHFVDFLQHVTGSNPTTVYALSPKTQDGSNRDDNVQVLIRFSDGSQATITYTALGDDSVAKERVELFGDEGIVTVDNFKHGRLKLRQDKGFEAQFETLRDSLRDGEPSPIPVAELVATSRTTFAIEQSIRDGEPVKVDSFSTE